MLVYSGIQQIGIGIPDVNEAFEWYRRNLGFDVPVFNDKGTAELMLPYTGGRPQDRHAILALNMQGGGGYEIWQYTSRKPQPPSFEMLIGDLGINIAKVKSNNIEEAFNNFQSEGIKLLSDIEKDPNGKFHFFIQDPYGNIIEIVDLNDRFIKTNSLIGGIYGATIGVSDIEKSMQFYKDILGYDMIIYDKQGEFNDLAGLPGGEHEFRRVLLTHSKPRKGPFSKLLGNSQIELIQAIDRKPNKIFKDRFWGDLGYIHLCYDIQGMGELKKLCDEKGYPFTVDSNPNAYENDNEKDTFDMGEASGHFSYIEDPDGTLIEFVEAHKLPILKKVGWYLDLKKRDNEKPLPTWMLKALRFNRVKN